MTDWEAINATATNISALAYGAGAVFGVIYLAITMTRRSYRHDKKWIYPLVRALRSNILVWGLTSLLYVWLSNVESTSYLTTFRWIPYTLCSMDLIGTALFTLSLFDDRDKRHLYSYSSDILRTVVLVTILSGFVVEFFGLLNGNNWWQFIALAVGMIYFVALAVMIYALRIKNKYVHIVSGPVITSVYIALVFWVAYPTIFVLKLWVQVLTPPQAAFAYIMADVVTKFIFSWVVLYIAGRVSAHRRSLEKSARHGKRHHRLREKDSKDYRSESLSGSGDSEEGFIMTI